MKKLSFSLSVILALLVFLPGILAQEDLSEEEQLAQFDRAVTALETFYGYDRYTAQIFNAASQNITVTIEDQSQTSNTAETLTGIFSVNRPARSISGTFTIEGSVTQDDVSTLYVLEGELRYVDDVLYVMAAYISGGDNPELIPPVSEGWTIVEDSENHPVFDILGIQDMIDNFDVESQQDNLEMFRALRDQVTNVIVEQTTLTDSTPIDLITISLDRSALLTMLSFSSEDVPPALITLLENLPEGEEIGQLIVAIDAESNTRVAAQVINLSFTDLDAALLIEGSPEGTTMSLIQNSVEGQEILVIDPELEAVTAPE